jgi:hypothetical protein
VRKREGKRPLGRPRRRWENNTKCLFKNVIWRREPCSPGSGQGQVVGCCPTGWTVQSLFHETAHTGTGAHTQPPIQWVSGVKRPGREVDNWLPFSSEVKNERSYTATPPVCLHGVGCDNYRPTFFRTSRQRPAKPHVVTGTETVYLVWNTTAVKPHFNTITTVFFFHCWPTRAKSKF